MINLEQRSYTNGVFFRPRPLIVERGQSHLVIVATPWGPVEAAQKACQVFMDQFELLSQEDVTTPYEALPAVSNASNKLRAAAQAANLYILKNENSKQWKVGVELAGIHFDHGVLSWVQVGCPHIMLLDRNTFHPLAYEPDWAFQTKNQGPLFSQGLGLDHVLPFRNGSMRVGQDAQLLLISRGTLPRVLFSSENFELDSVVQAMSDEDPEAPYWIGRIHFS